LWIKQLKLRATNTMALIAPEGTFGLPTGVELGRQLFQVCKEMVGDHPQPPWSVADSPDFSRRFVDIVSFMILKLPTF
jgi:hypothetical protein